MFERSAFRHLGTGPRPQRLALAARPIAEVNQRTEKLDAVWREAAAGDAAIATRLAEREAGRRADLAQGLTVTLDGAPDDTTPDGLWAITSPEPYHKLTGQGWSRDAYEAWLVTLLDRLTSPPSGQDPPTPG